MDGTPWQRFGADQIYLGVIDHEIIVKREVK